LLFRFLGSQIFKLARRNQGLEIHWIHCYRPKPEEFATRINGNFLSYKSVNNDQFIHF
jgi:hypothetical protein